MAEEKDGKISLSPRKTPPSADYTLKVPNFFTLPEYDGTFFNLNSPSFDFANATWRFLFQSRSRDITETGDCVKSFAVYMERINFEIPQQMISYTVILLNADDERYKFLADSDSFDESDNRNLMWVPNNEKPSYDTRDTLTVIIHLFDGDSKEMNGDKEPITMDRNTEILSQDFKKLFLEGKNRDLILRVADKEFRVHQDILAARSQVFEAMLGHNMEEKNKGVIDVPDCDPKAMEQFLFYVYSGKVESLNQDNVFGLYYAADKYNMISLKQECSELMIKSLCPSKFCDVIQLAMKHSDSRLLECATEYFKYNTNEIFRSPEWKSFLKLNLDAANELLLKASEKWCKH